MTKVESSFVDSNVEYFCKIQSGNVYLGSGNSTKPAINNSVDISLYVPSNCVINGVNYKVVGLLDYSFFSM